MPSTAIAESYEHIDPEQVGNERRVLVSELSGRSNIVAKTTKFTSWMHDPALMKTILDRVVDLENEGYQFEAAEASFDLLVKKCAGTYEPKFRAHSLPGKRRDRRRQDEPLTEATVKLRIDGDGPIKHEVAEGDGPVNALDTALRKALMETYPYPSLIDASGRL